MGVYGAIVNKGDTRSFSGILLDELVNWGRWVS